MMKNSDHIVLFDGVCNLCNSTVKFIAERDKQGIIQYAFLQSGAGMSLMNMYHLPIDKIKTFVFIENGVAYTKSTAALKLTKYLSGGWFLFGAFIIVPKFIRDGVYNIVSKNRYQWFGKSQTCTIPSPQLKSRLL